MIFMRPFVLVDQAAENLVTSYPGRRQAGDRDCAAIAVMVWWPQLPGPMRVAVRDVLSRDSAQVQWPGDQPPVGDLGPDSPHPALGIGVRSRAARRDPRHLDSRARQHRVGRLGELPGTVRNRNRVACSVGSISRFRACCVVHAPSGCAVTLRT
jgi:hypothetical protein